MNNGPSKPKLMLKEVDYDNLFKIIKLSDTLTESQKNCVAPNVVSFAEAYFADTPWFRAIFLDDVPIGFVMLETFSRDLPEEDQPSVYLWRFMIAKDHQNKGHGSRVMDLVIDFFQKQGYHTMYTSTVMEEPESPYNFYIKYGFTDTGKQEGGEQVLRYEFPKRSEYAPPKRTKTPLIPIIDSITIWTHQFEKMKNFYRNVLGFVLKQDHTDKIEFENNGPSFFICKHEDNSQSQALSGPLKNIELSFPCEGPEDVDTSYGILIENGAIPVSPPENNDKNQRIALFKDPDGNIHRIFADIESK